MGYFFRVASRHSAKQQETVKERMAAKMLPSHLCFFSCTPISSLDIIIFVTLLRVMDQLVWPKNPTPARCNVPYVRIGSYEGGDSLTYLVGKRKSWLASRWSNRRQVLANPVLRHRALRQIGQGQDSFFQIWLSFGLLGATLEEQYDTANSIYKDEDSTYVTNPKIGKAFRKVVHIGIVAWENSEPEKEIKQEQYKIFARYLALVSTALD